MLLETIILVELKEKKIDSDLDYYSKWDKGKLIIDA